MRKLISSALLFAALGAAVSGCSPTAVSDFVKPYRIDIRQGNYVTQEMVAQLKPGQTREQVRASLETLQRSIRDIQAALGNEPANALLQSMLIDTYHEEMRVLTTLNTAGPSGEEI
mgnify:CR=1 FL=1